MMRPIVISLFAMLSTGAAVGAEVTSAQNLSWAAYRDLTSQKFSQQFDILKRQGMRMIDVDAYAASGGMRYAMIWQKNDGRGWAEHRNMTSSKYHERWTEYRDRGWRPTDVEGYMAGSNLRFAGIWIENRENIGWKSWRNMTSATYGDRFKQMSDDGYYLVDMEAYATPSGLRYAAIWYKNTKSIAWAQLRNMTRDSYQTEVDKKTAQGFVMVDYEKYKDGSNTRYAAIWHKDGSPGRIVRTNRNKTGYANYFREYRDDGYRPVDFERDGGDYGAIWAKVTPTLANYKHRKTLDKKIADYRDVESFPGISGAIVLNGKVVWRAGDGHADTIAKKKAHGETIYPLASVSKVIGGTLFGRLEEKGRLRSGRRVEIAGSDTTRSRLPGLPAHHAHRLDQLLSHTGCVVHYDTTPGKANQNKHYATQRDAAASIWRTGLVDDCTIGSTRSYSTHAFTLLGAAMEVASGLKVPQLVREELAIPFDLDSLRVMYSTSSLPGDYDRSVWYSGGVPVPRGNNSWKAFGGGIEASAVDLARFGWLMGSDKLTSKAFRDGTLLSRRPNSVNGYAWNVRTVNSRRRASHGGSWTGAKSYLGVWPDLGLSIALLTNQRNHGGLTGLAEEMADLVLSDGSGS